MPHTAYPHLRLILLLLVVLLGPARAQNASELGLPLLVDYDKDDFRAHPQMWGSAQDARGVMAFANREGVVLFDGARWDLVPVPGAGTVRSVAADAEGTIWVFGERTLGYLAPDDAGTLAFASLQDHLPPALADFPATVGRVMIAGEAVYFISDAWVLWWDGVAFHFTEGDFGTPSVVNDHLYVVERGRGLTAWQDDERALMPGTEALGASGQGYVLAGGSAGWLVATSSRLLRYDGLVLTPIQSPIDELLATSPLTHALALPNDHLALAFDGAGVAVVDTDGQIVQRIDEAYGLADNAVYHLGLDRTGGVWIAHETGLAYAALGAATTLFDGRLGLPGTLDDLVRHDGVLYASTNRGVFRLRPGDGMQPATFERVPLPAALTDYRGFAVDGRDLLVATGDGVWRIADDSAQQVGAAGRAAYVLHTSRRHPGVVIAGMQHGLAVLRRDSDGWTDLGDIEGPDEMVRFMDEDAEGYVWAGTFEPTTYRVDLRDAVRLDAPLRVFGAEHGLRAQGNLPIWTRRGLVFGNMEQLLRFDADAERFVPTDAFGERSAEHGVVRFAEIPDSEAAVIFGPTAGPSFATGTEVGVSYPAGDSLAWAPGLLRPFPPLYAWALWPEADGTVWIGCTGGLVRYSGPLPSTAPSDFSAHVASVMLGVDSLVFGGAAGTDAPTFEADAQDFRFRYTAPLFGDPALSYRVRLDGLNEAWTPWTDEAQKDYTNLAPGRYTFRVQARDPHGALSTEARWGFAIRPAWYGTWWARSLGALLAVAAIAWAAREGPDLAQRAWARLPHRRVVSHYRLDELLGVGGAGQVWRAKNLARRQSDEPRTVAVKLVHEHVVDNGSRDSDASSGPQRLRREADILTGFDHPNIVRVYETGLWKGTPYLAMELLNGPTLRAHVAADGPLAPETAAHFFAALADALETVHAAGVVHRDIKGDNVLLDRDGDGLRPVLMDFGLARGGHMTTLTQLGALLGTLGYLAPEQAMGAEAEPSSDVFSLGVVMYEALTGQLPFQADNEIALLHAIFNQEPEPPHALAEVPRGLSDLVMQCLDREPCNRPSAADVAAACRALALSTVG